MGKIDLKSRLKKQTEQLVEGTISDNNISNDINGNIDRNVSINKGRNDDSNGNENKNTDRGVANTIVISKPVAVEKPKRVSYYLRPGTIKSIEKLAKKSGMGISQFLQELLDTTLDKIEIK